MDSLENLSKIGISFNVAGKFGISFNVADYSSFANMKKRALDSPNKILFKVTKPLPANDYLGSSLTKHTGQLSSL